MARTKSKTGTKRSGRRRPSSRGGWDRSRWLMALAVLGVITLIAAIPVYRWWWQKGEVSELGEGLKLLERQGCVSCHRDGSGCWRWRADGRRPASTDAIRDAVLNGRSAAEGFPAAMPAYAGRLQARQWQGLVVATGVLTGILGVPEDQELAAGRDIVAQMGCGSCHGALGGGGVANPGSLTGAVPGWYGRSFAALQRKEGGLETLLQDGGRQRKSLIPGVPPPLLNMPPYGERLDSVEMDLLVRYLEWLHDTPPSLEPS
ncbi:MAG: hypothetical protein GXP47_10760 [Acidobacteria bacterium]|nr:hypothetical protein [Acidobacteriota bacterium]